ncbi:D-lactate dehydrogenase [Conchiformibius kuhniae]|uniref:Quinone-dependent D-lactate dehydrogenase n=1 Tax=Conchiformibius kuhniae TaxID=211502 RepID=A0ABD8B6V5_9NEIS|nr:D-lactate dehydrogenase [Conchiformibius kuhniae]
MSLADLLRRIVGASHVLTGRAAEPFCTGYRFGAGSALAVVRPATLSEYWQVLQACTDADAVVICQAANTGLTGGSTPHGSYDRPVVLINTMRLKGIFLIDDNRQAVCLPAATLYELENRLQPLGREPHSVIGSSCIGASVVGGVCNNSGGALVRRGPAYTEMAVFARRNETGGLELVNHLGIDLGDTPEQILDNLQHGRFGNISRQGKGHDHDYCRHVRQIDADTPARFNADPARHHDASGSAGRVAVFAVRLDTFPADTDTAVFYIGSNSTAALTELRRDMLGSFAHLPVSGEYIHRDAFDLAEQYGKDLYYFIKYAGTRHLPKLFAAKAFADRLLPPHSSDRILQALSRLLPAHLPPLLRRYRNDYEHHLIIKTAGAGTAETRTYLQQYFADPHTGAFAECSPQEAQAAMLHRFAVASAAVRYRAVHHRDIADIVALDIALRRNDRDWFERLPPELDAQIARKLYYGHFFCHVFHQDYLVKQGKDCTAIEHAMLQLLDRRGARYPAEHNVGHLYRADPELADFYRRLDPTNSFNPGIGQTAKNKTWN